MIALVTFRRTRVGLNDDEFDNDPEDPACKKDPVDEFEGKSYCPLLIMLNPVFANIKYDQRLN